MDGRVIPPYWRPVYERPPLVYGMFPVHPYPFPPMLRPQGCCGGALPHSIPYSPATMVPMKAWCPPYAPFPFQEPATPMMPPDPASYQVQRTNRPTPMWESPESPESPWLRAYRQWEKK